MTDFAKRLLDRLGEATNRNQQILNKNEQAKQKLNAALPTIANSLQGNQVVLAALREVYGALEADGEELSTVILDLKEAQTSLDFATNMLEQAGYDFDNIKSFSQDEIWLADHLPTIKRAMDIFNLPKTKQALQDMKPGRFQEWVELIEEVKDERSIS